MTRRTCAAWPVMASLACGAVDAQPRESDAAPARTRFDTRLLRGASPGSVDLSRFERGDRLPPGLHALDVMRHGVSMGRRTVRFAADGPDAPARPCFDRSLAEATGLALAQLAPHQRATLDDPARCVQLAALVPAARAEYDAAQLALDVSVPQAALVDIARDAVDPALRDAGIPAFRVNYALNALHHDDRVRDGDHAHASLRLELGANAGRWRWRRRTTHAWRSGTPVRSHLLSATLERDIDALDAQLTLGDFHTRGAMFDTIGLRGIRIASDDRMLPPSHRTYAPVVRGVANTQARVQVRQGNALLYDTTVAPGPFALRDIQPLGLGGALDVRVVEADGRASTFSVPYAAIPGLLRRGQTRFGLAAGQWRGLHANNPGAPTDLVFQGTLQQGVRDGVTVQAGAQRAPGYAQALGGIAFSTNVGAFSIDRAQSWATRGPGTIAGNAVRIAYAGRMPIVGTTLDIAAWRHGSAGFRSLADALRRPAADAPASREHTRIDASLRHAFGRRAGVLTLGLVERTWRDAPARQRSLRVGWGLPLARHGLLQATFDQAIGGARRETTGTLSLSLPLAFGSGPGTLRAHASIVEARTTLHASASGAFGRDRRHAWGGGLSHALDAGGAGTTASATLATQGSAGRAGFGLSTSHASRQWSATAEGSVLAHAHGATFGMPLGDTTALVDAAHGRGAALLHPSVVRLDPTGRAIVPHLSPYRRNNVGVAMSGLPPDVHFAWTARTVVPRAGAVVRVALPTVHAPLRRLRILRNGTAAPFAADVRDLQGVSVGTVGRDGMVLLRAPTGTTHVDVHWRDAGEAVRCRIALPIDAQGAGSAAERHAIEAPCTDGR